MNRRLLMRQWKVESGKWKVKFIFNFPFSTFNFYSLFVHFIDNLLKLFRDKQPFHFERIRQFASID